MPALAMSDDGAELITARDDWAGYFSVIEPGRVRMPSLGWHTLAR
jgi:hypothetical protein